MMNRLILSIFAMLFVAGSAFAQTTVTGTVTDNYGPVYGVAVILDGTTVGTTTNASGNFSITVPDPQTAVLVFKFVGMNDVVEHLNGRVSNIEIRMIETANQLEDIVVIGYGTQKRANLTGAVASVSGEVLARTPVTSVAEAMVGKLPGVQITAVDGSPDAEIMIRVRGGGSITEDNSPLILVDGFEVSSLNDIPPTDIESVDVLKDAASTAIYGARGANGVILVTTKQPQEGRISVNVHSYIQIKTLSKKLDVMDPYEYVLMQWERQRARGAGNGATFSNQYGQPYEFYIYQGEEGIDWQDEIFGSNPIAKYFDVNLNAGTQNTKYKFTYSHNNSPGVLIDNGLIQSNLNFTINTKLSDHFTLEYRTRFINRVVNGDGTEGVSLLTALRTPPTRGLDDFMSIPSDNTYFDPDLFEEVTLFDPVEESAQNWKKRTRRTFNTQAALTYHILPGLSFRTEFGYEYQYDENRRFYGRETSTGRNNGNLPATQWSLTKNIKWQFTNVLNYNFTLEDRHDFQVMVGQELKNDDTSTSTYRARYFPEFISGPDAFNNITLGSPYESSSTGRSPIKVSSFFGRVNYGLDDKYLATFTIRADGSTKFSPSNQWGVFPAGALAWRINNEDFLKDNRDISNLKLRLSFGTAGNDRIQADLFRAYYGASWDNYAPGWTDGGNYYYTFYNQTYLWNPDIKWETTLTRNLGIDFGFWRERLNGSLDFYWNTTKDLLVPSDIPSSSGYTKIMSNYGQTSNKGIELALNGYIIEKEDFFLNATMNIGWNKTKIDRLASGETEWISTSGWGGTSQKNTDDFRAYVGSTKGQMYGFVNDGMYWFDDFEYKGSESTTYTWDLLPGVANSINLSGDPVKPGNAKFKKLTDYDPNDPNSMIVGDEDRTVIGKTTPKFSGGFGFNGKWRNFDFNVFFNYMYGFDVYNANKVVLTSWWDGDYKNLSMLVSKDKRFRNYDDMGNDLRRDQEALTKLNENATMWNPYSIGSPIMMSYGVEDGSFLRLNTLSIGYTIPQKITKQVRLNQVRIYATGYNLWTITGYSGYDPEVNIDVGLTPNIDYNSYPRSRTYTFGIQLGF